MRKLIFLIVFLLVSFPALATDHTIAKGDTTIGITAFGNVDWNPFPATSFPSPPYIRLIIVSGAANSRFVVTDGSDSGPGLVDETLTTQGTRVLYLGFRCRPYFDYSASTVVAGDKMTIVPE